MRRKTLGVFSLTLMTVVSVDSIRNLPATALFGNVLIIFFIFAGCFFLLPSALTAAELASNSREQGGIYIWVRDAFGHYFGFLAIWFQWIENVVWYPTILAFIVGTVGYLISPQIATNKFFLIPIILVIFWGTTLTNLRGSKFSANFSNFYAITGLLIPMALIAVSGIWWWAHGYRSQISFTKDTLLPNLGSKYIWVSLTAVMLSFCGMEVATVHGRDVRYPHKDYPKAMLYATIIIFLTILCGSLAIATVVPAQKLSLVSGIMQAFEAFFKAYHLSGILPLIALMVILGGLGGLHNWIVAPTRGLAIALQDVRRDSRWVKQNKHGVPANLLILQGIVVTLLTFVFLLLPTINSSYWLLTVLTSQMYMLMYVLMFAAAVRLRYKFKPQKGEKNFLIPGGKVGMWITASLGLIGCVITLIVGFIPPANIIVGSFWRYESLLIGSFLCLTLPPLLIYRYYKKRPSH